MALHCTSILHHLKKRHFNAPESQQKHIHLEIVSLNFNDVTMMPSMAWSSREQNWPAYASRNAQRALSSKCVKPWFQFISHLVTVTTSAFSFPFSVVVINQQTTWPWSMHTLVRHSISQTHTVACRNIYPSWTFPAFYNVITWWTTKQLKLLQLLA